MADKQFIENYLDVGYLQKKVVAPAQEQFRRLARTAEVSKNEPGIGNSQAAA